MRRVCDWLVVVRVEGRPGKWLLLKHAPLPESEDLGGPCLVIREEGLGHPLKYKDGPCLTDGVSSGECYVHRAEKLIRVADDCAIQYSWFRVFYYTNEA